MKTETYQLPPDILEEFESLPRPARAVIEWTPEMDALILRYWRKVERRPFEAKFRARYGCGSAQTFDRRLDQLQGGSK